MQRSGQLLLEFVDELYKVALVLPVLLLDGVHFQLNILLQVVPQLLTLHDPCPLALLRHLLLLLLLVFVVLLLLGYHILVYFVGLPLDR